MMVNYISVADWCDFFVLCFYKKFPLAGRFPLSKRCPGTGNHDILDGSDRFIDIPTFFDK